MDVVGYGESGYAYRKCHGEVQFRILLAECLLQTRVHISIVAAGGFFITVVDLVLARGSDQCESLRRC